MKLEEYGDWTVIEKCDGNIEFYEGHIHPQKCNRYIHYHKGYPFCTIDPKGNFYIGCALPLGKIRERKVIQASGIKNPFNPSLFSESQLLRLKEYLND